MTTQQQIIITLKSDDFSIPEFNKSAQMAPSLVSLICRLRKFYANGNKIANKLDQLHADYSENFHKAVSQFYQL